MNKIITLLNGYLIAREREQQAKNDKESFRASILKLLPPSRSYEWMLAGWGKVTYKKPKDSLTVDLEKLEHDFPTAYKACVSEEPNSRRFCVYPTKPAEIAALTGKEPRDGRLQPPLKPVA